MTTISSTSTPTPSLEMTNIVKRFDGTTAVDDVSLTMGDGELVVLVGPSGCGKSTLLRVAAGLTAADSGTVRLHGNIVDDGKSSLPPERRNVGLVFQDHSLFPHLSVHENVAFGLKKAERGASSKRVAEMLDLVNLGDLKDRYPHELSGGEQQRVAVARALAPRPSLLLLDEPFASLDTNLRAQVRRDVVDIVRATNIPTVLVTHEQSEALSIGDRLIVMQGGKIKQSGTAEEVFHEPSTKFVAEFMGEADFFPVTVDGSSLKSEIATMQSGGAVSTPVMMVRPDDIELTTDSQSAAKVVHTEFRGASHILTVELPSGRTVRSEVSHIDGLTVGTPVSVGLNHGHRPVIVDDV